MAYKTFHNARAKGNTLEATFPWYKERLQNKYLTYPRNKTHLDGSSWRFLNAGLDDFRDGCPTWAVLSRSPHAQSGLCPPVLFHGGTPACTSSRGRRKQFSKDKACCFSKQQTERQQMQAAVEAKPHPLALYPHYEQGMPPPQRTSAVPTPVTEHVDRGHGEQCREEECTEPSKQETGVVIGEKETSPNETNQRIKKRGPKNSYIKLKVSNTGVKEDQPPSQDQDIKKATKLLCDWVTSLGGETNITESTILGLFVSDFEKRPTLASPIQDDKADILPDELRNPVAALCRQNTNYVLIKDSETHIERAKHKLRAKNKKPVCGIRYHHPKPWKKINTEELDPNVNPEELEFGNETSEKDEALKHIHGTQAFRQFVISRGLREPKFLSNVLSKDEPETRARRRSDALCSPSTSRGTVRA